MDRRTRSSLIFAILLVAAVGVVLVAQAAVRGRSPAAAPPDAAGDAAMVVGVSDGDTIRVRLDSGRVERVRYIGIDAPELAHPADGIAAECFGDEATDANRRLVDGLAVILERDVSDRDRHGRLLRHVWIAGDGGSQLVALLLVSDGAADAHAYPPDIRWDRELAAAEATARNAAAGMWGACPGG